MKKSFICLLFTLIFAFFGNAQTEIDGEIAPKERAVLKKTIKVFPNPATNVVHVLGLLNSTKSQITVSDISGNVVMNHHWEIRDNSLSIPIPNLNSGIYIVTIVSKEQSIRTKFYKK